MPAGTRDNVTTIVGLRAYVAQSNIHGNAGLHGFRGIDPERRCDVHFVPIGAGSVRKDALIVEVDTENDKKDIDALDIALPRLGRRYNRDYKDDQQGFEKHSPSPLADVARSFTYTQG